MSLLIIVVFAFLAAASLIIMALFLATAIQTSPQARIRKRLDAILSRPNASQAEVRALLKESSFSEIPWLNNALDRLDFVRSITLLLERANLDVSPALFLLFSSFTGAITLAFLTLFDWSFSIALIAGIGASALPYLYARQLGRRRLRRFLEQMPDALDLIGQGLQAGLGLTQSMVFVAKEMPDPIGTEFSVFMEEINLGLPLADALKGLQEKIPLQEVRLLTIAMGVQREIGGSLAEMLKNLADVVRDRFRIERQIKSLTAQNRMSAWVVSSLPPVLAAFMFSMDAKLMNETFNNPMGRTMLLLALSFEVVGIFVFRKIIQVRI
ncbi:MAG TPA: type II secretion system F family protein [Candidatus Binatia bacterium]|jgi:tight adherence protein B